MAVTDPRQADNRIVFVNREFLDLTGYTEEAPSLTEKPNWPSG